MQEQNTPLKPDVISVNKTQSWFYGDIVKDHFFNPRKFMLTGEEKNFSYNGLGLVGSPACGDMMKIWIQVDPDTEVIKDCRWQTFGCGSAIASTSMLATMLTENNGMAIDLARKLRPQDIMERLGGLPARKIHCSVLGDKALRAAINDFYRQSGQTDKIEREDGRLIDKVLKITDKDIEEAVLEGADTLEKVQAKIKVGTGDPSCLPEVEQLLRFYKEKYFG